MNKSNRPVIVYGNDFSLNISVKRYDAQTDDYIDLDLSQVTDLEVYLTCSNNNTTIPLDFTTSGSYIKCQVQYRFLAPQTSYGIVVEAFDEENKHFRFEALPREGFLVVSNTSGYKPAENVDVIDIKARIGWGNTIDAYTKEEMDTKLEDYYDKEAVDGIVNPISERLTDAEGTLNDHTTQIDDLDNNIAINTADIATNKANITKNTNDIRALDEDVDSKQDILVSGENIKTINYQSIVGEGNITVGEDDYSKEYFTIESLADDNDIIFTPYNDNVLSYSVNKGEWVEGNEVTANKGDNVRWKGELIPDTDENFSSGTFTSTENINVKGNIMSLKHGDNFEGKLTISDLNLFAKLFYKCRTLIDAHNLILPATRLSEESYSSMFTGCTSLTKAPELPALTMSYGCYSQMFESCTSLTKAPELSATTLAHNCYSGMFLDCTALTIAPKLPALVASDQCYMAMFKGCTALVEAPELPAMTLRMNCYLSMFEGCTKLVKAPDLPALQLQTQVYQKMFKGCSQLQSVKMMATSVSAIHCLTDWMDDVSSTGTMLTDENITLPEGASGLPRGWKQITYIEKGALDEKQDVLVSGTNIKTINNESILGSGNITIEGGGVSSEPVDYSKEYFTIESLADDNTITFIPYSTNVLSYSIDDGSTWTEGNEVTVNNGDKVLWKGSNLKISMFNGCGKFNSTGNINVSGNIMSLEFGDDFVGQTTLTKTYQFQYLFNGCKKLIDAKDLILPATSLTLSCYARMFYACTSLTKAPDLPATTLANYCYSTMFSGCRSLTKAPDLPATTLTTQCYSTMFSGCTSLTKAPDLPATTLVNQCYINMFNGCTNLIYVKMLATSGVSELSRWMENVNSVGIMITSGQLELPKNSADGIPTGWTEIPFVGNVSLSSNLKTINNESIVGEGNITIEGGGSSEPIDYSKEYFTIESLADNNTITFTPYGPNVLSYSTDNGTTWTEGNEVTVNNGDKVLWKGVLTPEMEEYYASGKFISTGNINVQGNIMSLKYSDNFEDQLTISDDYLFISLFENCTTLIDAHNLILQATTLTESCYSNMFKGCTSLTKAPELPATNFNGSNCYDSMFQGCTSLVKAPEVLPATTLTYACYFYMFQGCTSLVKAPELPATSLVENCYQYMFQGCTSLTKAPELPAITLVTACYASMFQDCTRLQSVKMLATEITDEGLTDWMSNVSTTGTMITSGKVELPKNSNNGVPRGWTELQYTDPAALAAKQDTLVSGTNIKTINNESILGSGNITIEGGGSSEPVDYSKEYLTIESLADDNDISIIVKNNNVLSYSTDNGTTWTEGNSVTINNGEKVLWKGSNLSCGNDGPCTFESNNIANVSGNIMSLEFGDEFVGKTTITKQYQFSGVFSTFKVVNADNLILPATTLANWCYQSMFSGCRRLVKTPELPATVLAPNCYRSMFSNCIKLVKAPELPATALANSCYANMFNGCTALTKAPELPATILISYCYTYMFNGCTALTKAPELPATVLKSGCYNNMFTGCTALTKSPELSAPTLESYCYNNMFNGCTKLSYITMLATNISALGCLTNWASGVAASGTMITSGKITLTKNSANGIPTGWTELQYASDQCVQSTTPGIKIEVVNALPSTPVENTIYLVRAVEYNLTTATSVSELDPGQGAVIYSPHNIGTTITSASAGQIIDIWEDSEVFNQDRPDYATEGVEGNWQFREFTCDKTTVTPTSEGGGMIIMPAEDVYCIAEYDWIEQEQTEPEG